MFKKMLSFIRKIDVLQNQVDSLIEMVYGRPQEEDEFAKAKYGLSSRQCIRMGVMILKLQDDELKAHSIRRLYRWLDSDEGALNYFLDFQQLTMMLHAIYSPCCAVDDSVL